MHTSCALTLRRKFQTNGDQYENNTDKKRLKPKSITFLIVILIIVIIENELYTIQKQRERNYFGR